MCQIAFVQLISIQMWTRKGQLWVESKMLTFGKMFNHTQQIILLIISTLSTSHLLREYHLQILLIFHIYWSFSNNSRWCDCWRLWHWFCFTDYFKNSIKISWEFNVAQDNLCQLSGAIQNAWEVTQSLYLWIMFHDVNGALLSHYFSAVKFLKLKRKIGNRTNMKVKEAVQCVSEALLSHYLFSSVRI